VNQEHLDFLPGQGKYPEDRWKKASWIARRGLGRRREGRTYRLKSEGLVGMRVMFWTWITLIGAGLVFYSVIGLTHH
jgi:hypothetical protein